MFYLLLFLLPLLLFISLLFYLSPLINGYLAKQLCSCYFISRRQWEEVLRNELFLYIFRLRRVSRDDEAQRLGVSFLGVNTRTAAYRPGYGCVLCRESAVAEESLKLPDIHPRSLIQTTERLPDEALRPWFSSPPETYALLVLRKGEIIAEKYTKGITENTPLAGWSMAKSVISALCGILVGQQLLRLQDTLPPVLLEGPIGGRDRISLHDLLQMQSGLEWQERYWWRSDVTKMLFESEDVSRAIRRKRLVHTPGRHWQYASGTTNLISRWLRWLLKDDYHRFPYRELFGPLGMSSALLETDAAGHFVGSSFMLATARDWASFGQLYLQDGCMNGQRLLPEGWVDYTRSPAAAAPLGEYGAQFWLNHGRDGQRLLPSVSTDLYYASGFGGQRVIIIPSREAVVVRLGSGYFREPDFDQLLTGLLTFL